MPTLAWDRERNKELQWSRERDCWSALLSPPLPAQRGVAGWTWTRQASFLNQPESWELPGDKTS